MAVSILIKSPDAMVDWLKQAKKQELVVHPLTESLLTENEWQPPVHSSEKCALM